MMNDNACETIDLELLQTIQGGAGKKPTTAAPATTAVTPQKVGTDALSGCLTGIGGSLAKAKSPQDVGVGCVLGAGKSIFEGLGKAFGHSSK
jgi:hypothetical protein